jgi:hypothetical protein
MVLPVTRVEFSYHRLNGQLMIYFNEPRIYISEKEIRDFFKATGFNGRWDHPSSFNTAGCICFFDDVEASLFKMKYGIQ